MVTQSAAAGSIITLSQSTAIIPAGSSVTVGEGSRIGSSGSIVVNGTLSIVGTSSVVTVSGVGFHVASGGTLSLAHVDLGMTPKALTVDTDAQSAMLDFVHISQGGEISIQGGTVLIDHSTIEGGGGMNIGANAMNVEIRNSLLSTTGPSGPDFLVVNGGSVHAHHNTFSNTHCAFHVNSGGDVLIESNNINGNAYAIMFGGASVTLRDNNVGSATGSAPDELLQTALDGMLSVQNDFFSHGCPANAMHGVTVLGCANAPVSGAGPQP